MVKSIKRLKKRSDGRKMEKNRDLLDYDKNLYIRRECPKCNGKLLSEKALTKKILGRDIADIAALTLDELNDLLTNLRSQQAQELISSMRKRVRRLIDIGLGYLSLNRPIPTLSGGESQRLKLAKHLGINLVEMLYILDEPTIGMHPRDIDRIIRLLRRLRDKGNTVIVVEHDKEVIRSADFIIDIGPKAGLAGGKVVASGSSNEFMKQDSLTARYLKGSVSSTNKSQSRSANKLISFSNLKKNNLKNIDVKIAQNALNLIVGASGAGKSSLIEEIMGRVPQTVLIDQTSIGKTSRSNPATYTGLFDSIRNEIAKKLNCSKALLSFNSIGGCDKCKGQGLIKIDMNFLEDVEIVCSRCKGTRYKMEVLENIRYKELDMAQIMALQVNELKRVFSSKEVLAKSKLLEEVGLGYMKIGQEATHLSGGECQRIKLCKYLGNKGDLLILDEPTVGLHMYDIDKLMSLVHKIVDLGNTIIIVEHNIEVIKNADWIVELGPKGGINGGKVLYQGQIGEMIESKKSIIKEFVK
jgi:excinuclease UvrABC ATPase subunit